MMRHYVNGKRISRWRWMLSTGYFGRKYWMVVGNLWIENKAIYRNGNAYSVDK